MTFANLEVLQFHKSKTGLVDQGLREKKAEVYKNKGLEKRTIFLPGWLMKSETCEFSFV